MNSNTDVSRFDIGSILYRTDSIKYRKIAADKVSEFVIPSHNDVVLDIGCGTGSQLMELSPAIKKGIGIDISQGMIERCNSVLSKYNSSNLEFYLGGFLNPEQNIALSDYKINKIISNYALHHLKLEDKKAAIQKMINICGNSLEMIVIGDLMFFDNPDKYVNQYTEIGYGPSNDFPCYAEELAALFDSGLFDVTLEKLHPLVGVLKAVKRI